MGVGLQNNKGQMTVELAVCIPVFIAVAFVLYNAMLFIEHCAAFDRLALDAMRVYAASPAQGQSFADVSVLIQDSLSRSFQEDYLKVEVSSSSTAVGFASYSATLHFAPTLFGRGISQNVFGVGFYPLKHTAELCLDPYKAGVFI